jgi:hypothetical protein
MLGHHRNVILLPLVLGDMKGAKHESLQQQINYASCVVLAIKLKEEGHVWIPAGAEHLAQLIPWTIFGILAFCVCPCCDVPFSVWFQPCFLLSFLKRKQNLCLILPRGSLTITN